jgi:hypothetical protein
MIRPLVLFLAVLSICLTGFAQKNKDKNKDLPKEYKEDLSLYRPLYGMAEEKKQTLETKTQENIVPKNSINDFLNEKLDSVYSYNEKIVSADGYRILVYVGASSEDARAQRGYAFQVLPLDKSYTDWKQPNFKVKVGDFVDKLEAYYAYAKLIKVFPNAIVVPDKVNIVREK